MEIFYSPEIINGKNELGEEESFHCVKVLRHREGDEILIADGIGNFYKAKIILAHKAHCSFEVTEKWKGENALKFQLHLAIAPTKNLDRMEWLCEKATEIGVSEISFLECEHSERRKINLERMKRICVSAMKQSMRASVPKLNEMVGFQSFISERSKVKGEKFICHLSEKNISLASAYTKGNDAIVLIGPEGDFSNEELKLAADNGFTEVILGNSRLRTETAALVALVQLNSLVQ